MQLCQNKIKIARFRPPIQYVEQMLDNIGYIHNLWGRRVLENSCGEGNILIEIVKRYIADTKGRNYSPDKISRGLQNDIVTYEVDQEKINICLMRLNDLISSEKLPEVRWNIKHQDFLKSKEENVEFIIGNPPYITYHDLTQEEREFGNTKEGRQYIDALQLNSKFYREMRERQEQDDEANNELKKFLNEIYKCTDIPDDLIQKLKLLAYNHFLFQTNDQQNYVFRCGHSRAGQAFQDVLNILEKLSVPHELLFADKDIDIKIQYNGKEYLCGIVLNDKADKPVRCIHIKKAQRESWTAVGGSYSYGILYYYMKSGRLEFYRVDEENELLACLKDC